MTRHDDDLKIWALIQGRIATPSATPQLVPAPPGYGRLEVQDGATFGPMTHGDATAFADRLFDHKTLHIVPSDGVQAIWLEGLAWHAVDEALEHRRHMLPGMTFFPTDGEGILLVGFGESFDDIVTADAVASCSQAIAFPVGRTWAAPVRHRSGEMTRNVTDWTPPDMTTLEDLQPLAEFIRTLRFTDKDREAFLLAKLAREEAEQCAIQEQRQAEHAGGI